MNPLHHDEPDLRAHMIAFHEETAEDLDAIVAEMRQQAIDAPETYPHYVGKSDNWLLAMIHDRQHTSLDWDAGHDEDDLDVDPTPCCPDSGCGGNPCTFPGYADNH